MNKNNSVSHYNYNDWREKQRSQLRETSVIFFGFASAQLGFILTYFSKDVIKEMGSCKALYLLGLISLLTSLLFYVLLSLNRLTDFRKTSKLIREGFRPDEISRQTEDLGKQTWLFFYLQLGTLCFGTLLTIVLYLAHI